MATLVQPRAGRSDGSGLLIAGLAVAGIGAYLWTKRCSCNTEWVAVDPTLYPSGGYRPSVFPNPFTCNGVNYREPVSIAELDQYIASGTGLYWAPQPCQVQPLPSNKYFGGSGYQTWLKA